MTELRKDVAEVHVVLPAVFARDGVERFFLASAGPREHEGFRGGDERALVNTGKGMVDGCGRGRLRLGGGRRVATFTGENPPVMASVHTASMAKHGECIGTKKAVP